MTKSPITNVPSVQGSQAEAPVSSTTRPGPMALSLTAVAVAVVALVACGVAFVMNRPNHVLDAERVSGQLAPLNERLQALESHIDLRLASLPDSIKKTADDISASVVALQTTQQQLSEQAEKTNQALHQQQEALTAITNSMADTNTNLAQRTADISSLQTLVGKSDALTEKLSELDSVVAERLKNPVIVSSVAQRDSFAASSELGRVFVVYQTGKKKEALEFCTRHDLTVTDQNDLSRSFYFQTAEKQAPPEELLAEMSKMPDIFRRVSPAVKFGPKPESQSQMLRETFGRQILASLALSDGFSLNEGKSNEQPNPLLKRQWGYSRIKAAHARDLPIERKVRVAIIDSDGIDYLHPDLQNALLRRNGVVVEYPPASGDGSNTRRPESNVHGTYVAGVIASGSDDRVGICGIAADRVELIPIYLNPWKDDFQIELGACIAFAVDNDADILCISMGEYLDLRTPDGCNRKSNYINAFDDNINASSKARPLVVCSAGNGDKLADNHYPSAMSAMPGYEDYIVSVGATSRNDHRSKWRNATESGSNFGPNSVTLMAPGDEILTTTPLHSVNQRFNSEGSSAETENADLSLAFAWEYTQGTSLAAPHVAGVAAVLWSSPMYHDCTAGEIKSLLLENCELPSDPEVAVSLKSECVTGGIVSLDFLYNAPAAVNRFLAELTSELESRPKDTLLCGCWQDKQSAVDSMNTQASNHQGTPAENAQVSRAPQRFVPSEGLNEKDDSSVVDSVAPESNSNSSGHVVIAYDNHHSRTVVDAEIAILREQTGLRPESVVLEPHPLTEVLDLVRHQLQDAVDISYATDSLRVKKEQDVAQLIVRGRARGSNAQRTVQRAFENAVYHAYAQNDLKTKAPSVLCQLKISESDDAVDTNQSPLLALAVKAYSGGRHADAVSSFSQLVSKFPSEMSYHYWYAVSLIANGEEARAHNVLVHCFERFGSGRKQKAYKKSMAALEHVQGPIREQLSNLEIQARASIQQGQHRFLFRYGDALPTSANNSGISQTESVGKDDKDTASRIKSEFVPQEKQSDLDATSKVDTPKRIRIVPDDEESHITETTPTPPAASHPQLCNTTGCPAYPYYSASLSCPTSTANSACWSWFTGDSCLHSLAYPIDCCPISPCRVPPVAIRYRWRP